MINPERAILSVSQLNEIIKSKLETDARLMNCSIAGEISNFKRHSSGHLYFTLKDEKSRLRAIMFSSRSRGLAFVPEDGMRVICRGSIGVFDRDGQYQLYVDDMQPDGIGALYVAFTQLREKLASEGLFSDTRKRALPSYPRRIGVVTSPTGAVIRDICSTLKRRYPMATVVLAPALVQGPGAAQTIVAGIERLQRLTTLGSQPVDVIIVARGGGSLEELWPFNEEIVARAIAASIIPVVSAVGHETDYTIADFVADIRAATPTAAAELVAPHVQELRTQVEQATTRARNAVIWKYETERRRLNVIETAPVVTQPMRLIDRQRQNIDFFEHLLRQHITRPVALEQKRLSSLAERLYKADVKQKISKSRAHLEQMEFSVRTKTERTISAANNALDRTIAMLQALNPLSVLSRGYSLVYKENRERLITSVSDVKQGENLVIALSDGEVIAQVHGDEEREYGEQTRLDI